MVILTVKGHGKCNWIGQCIHLTLSDWGVCASVGHGEEPSGAPDEQVALGERDMGQ